MLHFFFNEGFPNQSFNRVPGDYNKNELELNKSLDIIGSINHIEIINT